MKLLLSENLRKKLIIALCWLMVLPLALAKDKSLVFFKDKPDVVFDPYSYFDDNAIARRKRNNIALTAFSDLPVSQHYIDSIRPLVDEITMKSRWLNAITVYASQKAICQIKEFHFVDSVYEVTPFLLKRNTCTFPEMIMHEAAESIQSFLHPAKNESPAFFRKRKEFLLSKQIKHLEGELFTENGYRGQGVKIAVLDAGFKDADVNPYLTHLFQHQRILKTYDFIDNDEHVFDGLNHGTMVLSCMAGKKDDQYLGLATEADYLLARTEKLLEVFADEENWIMAAEWADKNGADIISSSLGYAYHRYYTHDMNGTSSFVAKAARIAASKGILVVNSAGNSGNDDWEVITTPADVEKVLSIGGVDPESMTHILFSSYGPTADYRMKPNLVAMGEAAVGKGKRLKRSFGTSFSCPLVTGFSACVLQKNPDYTFDEFFNALEQSGHLYPYFDYAHGYGIPQAGYFFDENQDWRNRRNSGEGDDPNKNPDKKERIKSQENSLQTFHVHRQDDSLFVHIHHPDSTDKEKDTAAVSNLLYYHVVDTNDQVYEYATIKPSFHKPIKMKIDTSRVQLLRFYYRDTTDEFIVQTR